MGENKIQICLENLITISTVIYDTLIYVSMSEGRIYLVRKPGTSFFHSMIN